jgi:hypothetical protein
MGGSELRSRSRLARQRIRRGTFNDVTELKTVIAEWIEHRNQNPKPFKWTASAKSIIAKAGCE